MLFFSFVAAFISTTPAAFLLHVNGWGFSSTWKWLFGWAIAPSIVYFAIRAMTAQGDDEGLTTDFLAVAYAFVAPITIMLFYSA